MRSRVMRGLFTTLRTIVYAACFLSFFAWMALRVRSLDQSFGISLPASGAIPGVLLMAGGGLVALACIALFVSRGRGTPAPFDAPTEFVASGPYRYVRNPMYVGGLLVLAGFGLYLRSPSVLLMSLLVALIIHLFVVYYEEPTLRAKFGASYEKYCERVKRWIPARPQR